MRYCTNQKKIMRMVIRKIIMLQVLCSESGTFPPSNAQDGAHSVLSFVLVATGIVSEGEIGLKVGIVSDTGVERDVAIGTYESFVRVAKKTMDVATLANIVSAAFIFFGLFF
jgi:hypothetical protein